jgi:predicted DNA-binding transcriptional regulator YafY
MVVLLPIIFKKLSNGESLSTKQLSEEYNIPHRTIHDNITKHLKKLYPDNIKFSKSSNMWYSTKNILSETMLTAEEIITMTILEEYSKSFGEEFNTFTKILFNRFKRRTSYEIYKKTNFEKVTKNDDIKFALIKNAIKLRNTLECTYKDKKRLINPFKIVMFDGYWYALVIDNKDAKLKTFYLKGLNNIKFTDQTFEKIEQNIQDQLDSAINAHFKDKEPQQIELEIHKEIAKYFHRRPLSKKQYLRASEDDDYEIMTIFITDFMEIIPTIQQFLPFIKVISPDYLDAIIRKNMRNYDESDLSEYFEAD